MTTMRAQNRSPAMWKQRFDLLTNRLQGWWSQRESRERRLLKIGGLILGLALLWLVGVKPARQRIHQADQRLPVLQATALRVDAVIREAQALRRVQSGTIPASELTPALLASLQRAGLDERVILAESDIGVDGARQWTLSLNDISASRLMEWLAETPQTLRLQTRRIDVSRTRVDGRDRPGSVSGTLVLATAQEPI